jgi:hypothetical protein
VCYHLHCRHWSSPRVGPLQVKRDKWVVDRLDFSSLPRKEREARASAKEQEEVSLSQ